MDVSANMVGSRMRITGEKKKEKEVEFSGVLYLPPMF